MFKISNNREQFFQWDLNQKLIVSDSTITEVHFCNKTDDCSLVCEVYEQDGARLVDVPNILLTTDWDIRAYAYCNDCYTKQMARFKVQARTKPADYVYTETEVKTWDKLAADITEALQETEQAVADAVNATENATHAATEATAAANKANEAAEPIIQHKIANALIGTAKGDVIGLKDVSPIAHEMKVNVEGKNLINFEDYTFVGCVNNGNGSITANMNNLFYSRISTTALNNYFLGNRGQTFTFSVREIPTDTRLYVVIYGKCTDGASYKEFKGALGSRSMSFTIPNVFTEIQSTDLRMLVKTERYTDTTTVIKDIQLEKGSIATPYAPYIASVEGAKVYAHGNNLIPVPYVSTNGALTKGDTYTHNGVTCTINDDYSVKLNGTATGGNAVFYVNGSVGAWNLKAGTYTISAPKVENVQYTIDIINNVTGEVIYVNLVRTNTKTITLSHDSKVNIFRVIVYAGNSVNGITYPQIEAGATATQYEPYIAPVEYTADANGNVNGVAAIYPCTTLTTGTDGATVKCEYQRDINKAFAELYNAIISTGGNV